MWAVAFEKVVAGAIQAMLAALVVFPLALFVPATPVHLRINVFVLLTLLPLGSVMSAALGLAIGTRVEPKQVPLVFSLLVIPMTFLGCVYYPWGNLEPIKWLKIGVLINPLVYLNEGLRAALTPAGHMNLAVVYLVIAAFTAVLLRAGDQRLPSPRPRLTHRLPGQRTSPWWLTVCPSKLVESSTCAWREPSSQEPSSWPEPSWPVPSSWLQERPSWREPSSRPPSVRVATRRRPASERHPGS